MSLGHAQSWSGRKPVDRINNLMDELLEDEFLSIAEQQCLNIVCVATSRCCYTLFETGSFYHVGKDHGNSKH